MHMYFSAVSQQPKSRGSDMEPLCSQSEAFGVVDMAPSCCQSDPQMTPQTLELKKGVECDRVCCTAETAEPQTE